MSLTVKGAKIETTNPNWKNRKLGKIDWTMLVPGARSSPGNLRLELNGQAQEAVETIESHVRHVSDIGGPPDLHATELPPVALASNKRSPENGDQERQQRYLLTFPVFGGDAPSQIFQILMLLLFDWAVKANILGESGRNRASTAMVGGDEESGIGWGRWGRWRGAWRWRKVKDFSHREVNQEGKESTFFCLGIKSCKVKMKALDWIWCETLTVQSMFIIETLIRRWIY